MYKKNRQVETNLCHIPILQKSRNTNIKKQRWALTSILYEFKLYSPTNPQHDVHRNRQFIELFDTSLVNVPDSAGIAVERELSAEEAQLRHSSVIGRFHYGSTSHVPLVSSLVSKDQIVLVKADDD